jgi:hypothetical protein
MAAAKRSNSRWSLFQHAAKEDHGELNSPDLAFHPSAASKQHYLPKQHLAHHTTQSVLYYSCYHVQAFSIYFCFSKCKINCTTCDVVMLHCEKGITWISTLSVYIYIYINTFHRSNISQRPLDMKLVTITNNT